jgi:hypothetical protein
MKTLLTILTSFALTFTATAQTPTPSPTPSAPDYIQQLAPTPGNPAFAVADQTVSQIPVQTHMLFGTILRFAKSLWADPTQAQSIVDHLAEKAAPLFIAYGEFAGPLAVIDPVSYAKLPPIPPGYGWTISAPQANGTWIAGQRSVTITYAAPSPTPSPSPSP